MADPTGPLELAPGRAPVAGGAPRRPARARRAPAGPTRSGRTPPPDDAPTVVPFPSLRPRLGALFPAGSVRERLSRLGVGGRTRGRRARPGGELERTRRHLRTAAALLLASFLAFLTRHFFLDDFGLNELTAAGWQRWAVTLTLTGVVGWLSGPWAIGRRGLRVAEALTFGVPGLFFCWVHQHGLTVASPTARPLLAAAYPATSSAPWMLLIQIYGLFIPNRAGRAAAVLAVMAVVPLAGACATAWRFPEVRAVLFGQGLFSAMLVWILVSAGAALYGAAKLSSLRKAARDAREVGSYRLVERIGCGGMGEVFLAEHRLLRRPCAVKLIRPQLADDDRALTRFDTEVRAAARLTHPNTIEVYDFGVSEDGLFYCVMEYLPGLTLHQLVQRAGPLPPGRAVHLLAPVCGALAEAHQVGLIHRDIKPANIIAADRGGVRDVPKLLDFGLVKRVAGLASVPPTAGEPTAGEPTGGELTGGIEHEPDPQLTQHGSVVGSPLFAAPEVACGGAPTAASDLYGIGSTAYFLLTGRPVFDENSPARALAAHARRAPKPVHEANPAVPADLSGVVMRCLRKDPAERYPSAAALGAALRACACAAEWSDAAARDWWAACEGTPSARHPVDLSDDFSLDGAPRSESWDVDDTLGDYLLEDDTRVASGAPGDAAATATAE